MAFDPRGRRFACSVGHKASLWDMEKRRSINAWILPEGLCDSLAFSGEDHLMFVPQKTKSLQGGPFGQFHPSQFPRVVRLYNLLSPAPTHPVAKITGFD